MKKEKVDGWLQRNSERIGIEHNGIEEVKSGESNHNFVIDSGTRQLVLRVSRDISRECRLENEAEKLDFLEFESISRVPQKIFYEENTELGNVLIETYIGSSDVEPGEMNEARIRSLAGKIAEIHTIPAQHFEEFAGRNQKSSKDLRKVFREDFRKWSRRPFEEYMDLVDEPDEQIETAFKRQKELLKDVPSIEVERGINHGDLGSNLRIDNDTVFIVDWEFSRMDFPAGEILYFFKREDFGQEEQKIFLEEYQKFRSLGKGFEAMKDLYPRFLAFNDMIWAAKRVAQGDDKKEMLERRKKELEEYYDN